MRYRRSSTTGGTYFFTVNLAQRKSDLLVRNIDVLRSVLGQVKRAHPFAVVAMVVLPEHLHAIWRLPPGDADYPMRWSLIKAGFSRQLNKVESIGASRKTRRERGIWQRRYWEHQVRNETDLAHHVDYIHYNPVKHSLVAQPVDWPHSTLHDYIERKLVSKNWGVGMIDNVDDYGER